MSGLFEDFIDLDALADEIASDDPQRRRVAVLSLSDSGASEAIALLARLVGDAHPDVRKQVAIGL